MASSLSITDVNVAGGASQATHTEQAPSAVYIYNQTDKLIFTDNMLNGSFSGAKIGNRTGTFTNTIINNNYGFTTEKWGSATIVSGQTSITVAHGLSFSTPTSVVVTPAEQIGATSASEYWVDTLGTTNFVIRTDVDPGADVTFFWHAKWQSP